jgi:hypothetical protein
MGLLVKESAKENSGVRIQNSEGIGEATFTETLLAHT